MATLTGRTPKNSYPELLKIDNFTINNQLTAVETGDGTHTPLALSTSRISLNGITWPNTGASPMRILALDQTGTSAIWIDAAEASPGTVTSVGLEMPSDYIVDATPVTTSGNLNVTRASQLAKTFLAAPVSSDGVPVYRSINAADIPTLNQSTTGSSATLTTPRSIGMTGDVTWSIAAFDGSANVTSSATLANTTVVPGTYGSATQSVTFTVDAKGRITNSTSVTVTPDWANVANKPTTLTGYGITDSVPSDHVGSGGSTHALVTSSVAGFMSAADKAKLDAMTPSEYGSVTGVTAVAPLISSGGTAPELSLPVATATADGYMSSALVAKLNGIQAGAQVNVATNISQGTRTGTTVAINSSTGTGATLSVATTSLAGVMSAADKTKLDGLTQGGSGTVTAVTAVAPLTSTGGTTPELSIALATTSAPGAMSAADKLKLDGLTQGGGGSLNSVTAVAPLVSSGGTDPQLTINLATTSTPGAMSAADKTKLNGISTGATNNVGTVTSVDVSGPPSVMYSTNGAVTSSGAVDLEFYETDPNMFLASPSNANGVPRFRLISAVDIPTLNQNTTGNAGSVTDGVYITGNQSITGIKTFNGVWHTFTNTRNSADALSNSIRVAAGPSSSINFASVAFQSSTKITQFGLRNESGTWNLGWYNDAGTKIFVVPETQLTDGMLTVTGGVVGSLAGTAVTTTAVQTVANKSLVSTTIGGYVKFASQVSNAHNGAATLTLDYSSGQKQFLTLAGNVTISSTFPGIGNYQLILQQDNTGGRTVTWGGQVRFLSSVGAPAINTAVNSYTMVSIYWDGSVSWIGVNKVGAT
jgi:hypothetical protein